MFADINIYPKCLSITDTLFLDTKTSCGIVHNVYLLVHALTYVLQYPVISCCIYSNIAFYKTCCWHIKVIAYHVLGLLFSLCNQADFCIHEISRRVLSIAMVCILRRD